MPRSSPRMKRARLPTNLPQSCNSAKGASCPSSAPAVPPFANNGDSPTPKSTTPSSVTDKGNPPLVPVNAWVSLTPPFAPLFGAAASTVATPAADLGDRHVWGERDHLHTAPLPCASTKPASPPPGFFAPLDGVFEIACGALILAGLLTRLAVVPMIVNMTDEWSTASHGHRGLADSHSQWTYHRIPVTPKVVWASDFQKIAWNLAADWPPITTNPRVCLSGLSCGCRQCRIRCLQE